MKNIYKINTLRQILFLILIGFLFGIIKVEFFLNFIDNEISSITRTLSYITLGLSTSFFYLMIILSISASFITLEWIKLGSHFKLKNFYISINYFIWSLMINELSKVLITIFTFKNVSIIKTENDFQNEIINNSLWLELINISDILFIVLGSLIYAYMIDEKDNNVSIKEAIISTIPLLGSFIVFRYIS